MSFHFLLFTITIKKRIYTEDQLQKLLHNKKAQERLNYYKSKYWI
ncbi:YrzI family small protein [Alkalihalobacillus sp. MEB130]|nr:YrzI family small protein [Alkalihalobacillus sp. MEB130]MDT8861608.1 YrzI family small protein [Alkalihalobacillus sp. MEB130]